MLVRTVVPFHQQCKISQLQMITGKIYSLICSSSALSYPNASRSPPDLNNITPAENTMLLNNPHYQSVLVKLHYRPAPNCRYHSSFATSKPSSFWQPSMHYYQLIIIRALSSLFGHSSLVTGSNIMLQARALHYLRQAITSHFIRAL
jgi:hypothetical protein